MVKQLNYVWLTAEITEWQLQNTSSTLIALACVTLWDSLSSPYWMLSHVILVY